MTSLVLRFRLEKKIRGLVKGPTSGRVMDVLEELLEERQALRDQNAGLIRYLRGQYGASQPQPIPEPQLAQTD